MKSSFIVVKFNFFVCPVHDRDPSTTKGNKHVAFTTFYNYLCNMIGFIVYWSLLFVHVHVCLWICLTIMWDSNSNLTIALCLTPNYDSNHVLYCWPYCQQEHNSPYSFLLKLVARGLMLTVVPHSGWLSQFKPLLFI